LPYLIRQAEKEPKRYSKPSIENFSFTHIGAQNIFSVNLGEFFADGEERTYLVEASPGTYVLYGSGASRALLSCNCLGTVKFEAKAGEITNLGALYLDEVHEQSDIPYLEDNRGKSMAVYSVILGQAIVPATSNSQTPSSLKSFPIVPGVYEAVGPFIEPGTVSINRLAPIPGILGHRLINFIQIRAEASLMSAR
jgi:hypothetical protein